MDIRLIRLILLSLTCAGLFHLQGFAQSTLAEKHVVVSLRMIGHQVLLAVGDSTSRVLPVVVEDGKYRIRFENEIALRPEELVTIVNRVVAETNIATSFILEVEECATKDIFYAFEVSPADSSDIIPCRARELPKACYSILFTITGVNASPEAAASDTEKNTYYSWKWVFIGLIASAALIIGSVIYINRKTKKPALPNPNWISLGKYHFDTLNAELILEEQRIELTSKESDLLLLLYKTVNTTVEKEVLLNKVWGDEGDYIGRTLDVFISKLRKKLEFDPRIKIVNIRGIGYKLVMDV